MMKQWSGKQASCTYKEGTCPKTNGKVAEHNAWFPCRWIWIVFVIHPSSKHTSPALRLVSCSSRCQPPGCRQVTPRTSRVKENLTYIHPQTHASEFPTHLTCMFLQRNNKDTSKTCKLCTEKQNARQSNPQLPFFEAPLHCHVAQHASGLVSEGEITASAETVVEEW